MTKFATHINDAITRALDVLSEDLDHVGDDAPANDAADVAALVEKIGVVRVLEALRDAADAGADAAMGSGSRNPPLPHVTRDDLKYVSGMLTNAVRACRGGE